MVWGGYGLNPEEYPPEMHFALYRENGVTCHYVIQISLMPSEPGVWITQHWQMSVVGQTERDK